MAPPVYKIYIPPTSSSLARPEFSIQTELRVSCCLLVTAQLVGRISNIFSFIIILLRPLHLPSDSSRSPPPPSDNESDQDQLSLPAEDFKRQHRDVAFIELYWWSVLGRGPPVNH